MWEILIYLHYFLVSIVLQIYAKIKSSWIKKYFTVVETCLINMFDNGHNKNKISQANSDNHGLPKAKQIDL